MNRRPGRNRRRSHGGELLSTAGKTLDLVSLGDLMIDFTCVGRGGSGMLLF